MKKISLHLLVLFLLVYQSASAQEQEAYIEVTGKAVQEIVPDELYLSIEIIEVQDGKNEKTIESQEAQLKEILAELNIPLKKLRVTGSNSHLRSSGWFQSDETHIYKEYELLLSTAETMQAVIEKLAAIEILEVRLVRISHSQLPELKEQLRVEAIKDAKAKADYLLNALGSKTGAPLIVRELGDAGIITGGMVSQYGNANIRGSRGSNTNYFIDGIMYDPPVIQTNRFQALEFNNLKIGASLFVRFAIVGP